jgi:RNA polymerase sigma factor (sigma-70 family)
VGRDEDYTAYVSARRGALVRAAVLLGCSVHEAEDVVQSALIRCYIAWDKVAHARDPDAYVYRILVNCLAASRKRRWWGERPTPDLPDDPVQGDAADSAALTALVRSALLRPSESHREVLVRQVAEVLGIPAGTVKSRLSRSLAQLSTDTQLNDLPGDRSM